MALMDIFNGFRGATTSNPAAPPPNPATPATVVANPTVPSSATPTSDGTNPAFPATTTEGAKSPLDGFADLWKIDDKSKTASPTLSPVMTVEPAKIMQAARQIDFTQGIDTTLVDKATKGDAAALMQVINAAAQNAFAQGAAATTRIVDTGFKAQETNFTNTVMPNILRKHSINQAVAESPLANNPAAAPLISMLEQQLTQKFPTASPAEIKNHANKYMEEFAAAIITNNGGTIVPQNANTTTGPFAAKDTEWDKWFGVDGSMG